METNEIAWPTWNDLLDWSMAKAPDEIVGKTGNCETCIIANYLHEQYPEWYFYINSCDGTSQGSFHGDYKAQNQPFVRGEEVRRRKELPIAVNEIASEFDKQFTDGWAYNVPVTAGQFEQAFADRRV